MGNWVFLLGGGILGVVGRDERGFATIANGEIARVSILCVCVEGG